jgi:hypothetical protein
VVGQISTRAGGSLSLRSASGRVTYYGDRTNSRNVPNFPGTFVRVSLPRKAEARSQEQENLKKDREYS